MSCYHFLRRPQQMPAYSRQGPLKTPNQPLMQLAEIQTSLGSTYSFMTTYWKLNVRKSSLMVPIWEEIEPPELFPANNHKLPVYHMSSFTARQKGNAPTAHDSGHLQVITADESSRGNGYVMPREQDSISEIPECI